MFNIIKLTISNRVGYPLLESKYSYSELLERPARAATADMVTEPLPSSMASSTAAASSAANGRVVLVILVFIVIT